MTIAKLSAIFEAQSVIGFTGSAGPLGSAGYTGSQGAQGNIGFTGSRGILGYTGSTGYVGSQGNQGTTGYTGSKGDVGYTGSRGDIGYTGSKGDTGLGFSIAKVYANVAALTSDTSPTGIIAGQFALIDTNDVNDPENSRLYLWNGTNYTYVNDLSGAIGITGPTGPTGVVGYTGSTLAGGVTYTVVNSGASSYTIANSNNPTLTFIKGFTYYFNVSASGHPFWIKTAQATGTGSAYTSGVTNNGIENGTIVFTVPFDAPSTLYYICQYHGSMTGVIQIADSAVGFAGSQGSIGYSGSQGEVGYVGSRGDLGYVGSQGSIGYSGSQGDLGYTGSIGYVGSRGVPEYTVSSSPPVSPIVGDRWLDSTEGIEYTYINDGDGNLWVELGSISSVASVNGLLNSNLVLGSSSSTTVEFNSRIGSDLIPSANETFSIGTDNLRWANIYLAANTINLGTVALSSSNGQLVLPANVKVGNAFIDGNTGGIVATGTAASGGVPKISAIDYPGDDTAANSAGGQTITLTGTGFQIGATVILDGAAVGVVSVVSSTQIDFTAPAKSVGGYIIYVVNPDGGTAIAVPGIQYSGTPTWSTAAGNIGSYIETQTVSNTLTATGDAPITYTVVSGTLPPGATLNANGTVTGTSQLTGSPTTYTFTVRASDAQNQDTDRSFNLTIIPDTVTWASPANATEYTISNDTAISNVSLSATSAVGSAITYTANALPTGISLAGATISGTPTGYAENTTIGTLLTANATATTRTATRTISWSVQVGDTYFNLSSALLQADSKTFITDSSTNNFTSVTYNGAKPNRLSPHWPGGWSGYFDGSGDYLSLTGTALGTGDFTIEFWLFVSSMSSTFAPFSYGTSDTGSNGEIYIGTNGQIYWYNSGERITSASGVIGRNTWYHIAVCKSSNVTKLFVNGTQVGSNYADTTNYTSTTIYIGQGYGVASLTGYVSNFRQTNTAVYTANFTPSTTSLTTVANTSLLTLRDSILSDDSPNNFTITRNGDTRLTAFSPFNTTPHTITANSYSVYFDGTGDYLTLTANAAFVPAGDFTLECWVYRTASAADYTIAGYSSASSTVYSLRFNTSGNIIFLWYNNSTTAHTATSSTTVTANAWHHVAVTFEGSNIKLWVNGSLSHTVAFTGSTRSVASPSLGIGSWGSSTTEPQMLGYVSNFRIIKGTAVYTSTFAVPAETLTAVANTSLLTCHTTTLTDASTNAFTITQNGDASPSTVNPFGETVVAISNYTWSANSYGASTFFDTTGYIVTTTTSAAMAPGTGDFTCEAWIYHNGSDIAGIVEARPGGNWVMFVQSNGLYLFHGGVGQNGFGTIPVNQWSHVALSRSGGIIYYFINGRQVGTWSNANNMTGGTSCYIGSNLGGGGTGYAPNAYMSDIRLVIGTALYTKSFLPPTAPLTAIANTTLLILQADIGHNNNLYVDHSGHNHLITRNGNTTQGSLSPLIPSGWSLYFDGTGDSLSYTGVALTGDFTVECWIYKTVRNASGYTIVLNNNSAPNRGGTQFTYDNTTDGSIGLYLQNTSVISPSGTAVLANQWNHLAWTRSGSTCRAFVNGLLQGSGTYSGTTGILDLVSSYQLSGGYGITGYLNNLRIVDGTALYTANFTPSTTTLSSIAGTRLLLARGPSLSDDGPNNFAITRYGDVTTTPFSPFKPHSITPKSYSVYFDGTGDYLTVAANTAFQFGTGNLTIEFWLNYTSLTNFQTIISSGYVGSVIAGGWIIQTGNGDGKVNFYYQSAGSASLIASDAGSTVLTNTWYHIAVVRNAGTTTIYRNGQSVGSASDSINYNANSNVVIGGGSNTGFNNYWVNGYISNLRILKGTALYTANFTPSTTALTSIANTSLLTCQSSTIIDNSTNAFAITVNGDARPRAFNPFGDTVTPGVAYTPATHGGSAYFDGNGDFLTLPTGSTWDFGTANFTIEFWIYPTGSSGAYARFFQTANGDTTAGIGLSRNNTADGLALFLSSNGTSYDIINGSATTYDLNTWTHFAFVRNGTGFTLYKNGVSVVTATSSSAIYYSAAHVPVIGGQTGGRFYAGYLANFRIIKGTALYTSAFVPALTAPAAVNNTSLLLNFTNGGIVDGTGRTVLETVGTARVINNITKYGTGSIYIPNNDTSSARYRTFDNSLTFGTGSWTVEFWTYIITASPNGWLIFASTDPYSSDGASIGWGVGYNVDSTDSKFQSIINNNGSLVGIESTNTYSYNTWYHVALTYDKTTLRQFVNGSLQGSSAGSYNITTSNLHLFVGWAPISGVRISAYFDDVRITRGAARYTANFTPPTLHQNK